MPYFINIHTNKVFTSLPEAVKKLTELSSVKTVYDTEYTIKLSLLIDSIQLYCPALCLDYGLVYLADELTPDFNPWIAPFIAFGYHTKIFDVDLLDVMHSEFNKVYYAMRDQLAIKKVKPAFIAAVNEGLFDDCCKKWNVEKSSLTCTITKGEDDFSLVHPKITIEYEAFLADVDLFKTVGQKFQDILLFSKLESRRVIKSADRNVIEHYPTYIDHRLYNVEIKLRDSINRLPPSKKSLENQCLVLNTKYKKLNVETEDLAFKLGHNSVEDIKTDMTKFRKTLVEFFAQYGVIDCFASHSLSESQQSYLNTIHSDFDLEHTEIKDTTGSNVSQFILDLMKFHFGVDNKKTEDALKKQRKLGNADTIQKIELNRYGIQPLETVGGLLFSRVARYPVLKGFFGDLDEVSCYATKLSNMSVYLGQPIITSFKAQKFKPTLAQALKTINEQKCPRDGWIVRVTGKFQKVVNTLILSNLGFTSKRELFNTVWDKNPNQSYIEEFNAYKASDSEANSTLLTKEVKFGLINADILDCINLMPDSWVQEYLDLKVDVLSFVPQELICDDLDELEVIKENYDAEEYTEKFDVKTGLLQINTIRAKNNVCLKFPIGDYYKQLKNKRSDYKDDKNPIQEIYKLFLNSGYGALSCRHLPVNNLLAANQITASARATSWMMLYALNGLQVITDGATFSWKHIPLGLKFKDILESNPNYLIDFDPNIESGLSEANFSQGWINKSFKQHLYDFFDVDENHVPANLYNFELKTEDFTDSKGVVHTTTLFTEFHNTGSGNYSKGLDGSHILIDGTEYDFTEQHRPIKARSYKGNKPDLLAWYVDSLDNGYKRPIIDSQSEIIKFGEACKLAVKYLKSSTEIIFPSGLMQQKFKVMKLITRSQFLFQTEKQLRNFERVNQLGKLDVLSKVPLGIKFWSKVTLEDLAPYGVTELKPECDYRLYNQKHPVGLGFELLCLMGIHKGSVASVRNLIADKIATGTTNFNAALHLDRNLFLASEFDNFFAALVVLRANAEIDLRNILVASIDQPTAMVVNQDNVKRLSEVLPGMWAGDD